MMENGPEHTYRHLSTMEKAELLLVRIQKDPDLAGHLWNPETRDEVLAAVDLTKAEVDSLMDEVNSYDPPTALVKW